MVKLKEVSLIWITYLPIVAILSGMMIGIGYLTHLAEWNLVSPIGMFCLLGFGGLAFGLEKHIFSWKKWVVLGSGLILTVFAISITNVDFSKIWGWWAVVMATMSAVFAIDEAQTSITRLCPDAWTGIALASSATAILTILANN